MRTLAFWLSLVVGQMQTKNSTIRKNSEIAWFISLLIALINPLTTVALILNTSREDYIELLKYAEERNVKILPEVSEHDCHL